MDIADVQEMMADIMGIRVPLFAAKLAFFGATIILAFVVSRLIGRAAQRFLEKASIPSASIFVNVVRALVWVMAFLVMLQPVFGIEPTGFVAALGITSVALSLGMQDTISNLFGGFSLMAGKVIVPGDIVTVDGTTGEVTDINWRSTTVRQFNGDLQVIPNSVLSKTELTKLAPFQAGEFPLPVMLAKDADLNEVRAEIDTIAREALREYYDEEFGTPVFVKEFTNWGILVNISLHCKPGIAPGRARTAVAEAIMGKSWLA